jgi:hypothetical protein
VPWTPRQRTAFLRRTYRAVRRNEGFRDRFPIDEWHYREDIKGYVTPLPHPFPKWVPVAELCPEDLNLMPVYRETFAPGVAPRRPPRRRQIVDPEAANRVSTLTVADLEKVYQELMAPCNWQWILPPAPCRLEDNTDALMASIAVHHLTHREGSILKQLSDSSRPTQSAPAHTNQEVKPCLLP